MSSRAENKRNALLVVKTEERRPPHLPPPLSLTKAHSFSSIKCFQNKHMPKSPLHRVQDCECVSQVSPAVGVPPSRSRSLAQRGFHRAGITICPMMVPTLPDSLCYQAGPWSPPLTLSLFLQCVQFSATTDVQVTTA